MPALRELQEAFAAAAFGDDTARQHFLDRFVPASGRRAGQGLAAYCTSIQANLAGALVATYPLLEAIVGPEFFIMAARAYAEQVPSRSGDLNRYGEDFERFLGCYAPAASLPYLPDVARLEWRIQQVHMAPDAPATDLELLARTVGDGWGQLIFQLDPGHQLLASAWPLARIWEVHQAGYQGDFTVDFSQPQSVLIQRRTAGVLVTVLAPGEHAFLAALGRSEPLAVAVATAVDQAPGFDLGGILQRHLASGLILRAIASPKLEEHS